MIRRSKTWRAVAAVAAVLFFLVNLGGVVMAAVAGEVLHTGLHVGLLLLGAYGVWRLALRRDAGRIWPWGKSSAAAAPPPELTNRLTHLEQSIDAVAVEVERIGEGQRFVTRLFTESATPQAPGERAAEPIGVNHGTAGGAAAPPVRSY
jgi:hypothetical protein